MTGVSTSQPGAMPTPAGRRAGAGGYGRATLLLPLLLVTAPARDSGPAVTIVGGVRADNPQYFDWTVTNHHSQPIVFLEFPHYRGDTFIAPPGWENQWKNRAMAGARVEPGWVRTSTDDPLRGIPPNGSARFSLRLTRAGALARPGTVSVRFADGSEVAVGGVELPSAPSLLERNVMGIGLALIFVVALLVHIRRSRRKAAAQARPG